MASNIICGARLIRTVRWLMSTCRQNVMEQLRSDFSGGCCEAMAANPERSWPTNCAAMGLLTGNWCPRRSTVLNSMRITGLSNRMSRPGRGSEGWGNLSQWGRRRDFLVLMRLFTIYLISGGTLFVRSIIGIWGKVRFQNGVGQLLEENWSELLRSRTLTCRYPYKQSWLSWVVRILFSDLPQRLFKNLGWLPTTNQMLLIYNHCWYRTDPRRLIVPLQFAHILFVFIWR